MSIIVDLYILTGNFHYGVNINRSMLVVFGPLEQKKSDIQDGRSTRLYLRRQLESYDAKTKKKKYRFLNPRIRITQTLSSPW